MSDEEPVCPLPAMRKACEPKCTDAYKAYLSCVDRIEAKGGGATRRRSSRPGSRTPRAHPWASDCEPYYFDWLKCLDKCAMPHIMQKLK
ncbi:ubiquinol-cytochrome-c reductase [Aureococcus anophagefferens]|uniref:Ubiquinol-cytochrome-c reductase n=1 Tax=Aureococcus anophagefferens TaxID=44056 RepID=A0ABR1FQJ7_AURAN|nr:ubiquinol-cytochrome-c reductase [Aureococcus anophagefferens]KAH8096021.1 ubiquinol-cytochrome-c reductase [Aureococcus anophagefferens]